MIKKIKVKETKKFLKLFNNKMYDEIWKKIKIDFIEYEWDRAEFYIDGFDKFYILFENFKKK